MLVSCAAVYQNSNREILLQYQGDYGDEPVYELPFVRYERESCHRPEEFEWSQIGARDHILFTQGSLIRCITRERELYYSAQPAKTTPIDVSKKDTLIFSDLRKGEAQFGHIVLAPLARRLLWYLQNENTLA